MSILFADKTSEDLNDAVKKNSLILLPIGTIEEHGKHLPVDTDSKIVTEVARRVALEIEQKIPVLVLPAIWTGYSSKEMSRWTGTFRIPTRTVMDLVFGVCGSLVEMGFKKIVIVSGHGHHGDLLSVVAREVADAFGVYIAVTDPAKFSVEAMKKYRKSKPGGAIHGGEWETSMLLAMGDERVDMSKTTDEDIMKYHSEFIPGDNFTSGKKAFWSTWGIQESKTGIYGDPTVACRELGEKCLEEIVENYVKFIDEFYSR